MNIFDEMNRSRNAALWQMLRRGVGFSSSTPVIPGSDQSAAKAFNDALAKAKPDSKGVKHVTLGKEIANQIEKQKDSNVAFVIETGTNVEVTIPEYVTISAPADVTAKDSSAPTARAARDLDCLFLVKKGSTLTLKGKGTIDATKRGAELYCAIKLTTKGENEPGDYATVIIDGVTVKGHYAAIAGNGLRSDTKIVVKSGKLEAVAAEEDGTPNNTTIFNPQQNSEIVIEGGELVGGANIVIKAGTLTITGGKLTANGVAKNYVASNNGFNLTGHSILVDNCGYPGGIPVVAGISGATITAEHRPEKPILVATTKNAKGEFDVAHMPEGLYEEYSEVSKEPESPAESPVEEPAPETGTSETEQA